ncbi:GntR family transcriptional regulator [Azospirillum sp. ST 5-10]|uniref:GntR family transcriptional regulator n=1 Tax=unclassified Azospirillum TaxID=2630922 RepID=UPI003F49DE27
MGALDRGAAVAVRASGADHRPLYTQVRDLMIGRIGSGAWKPGEMIPSEFQLASEFGVSQGTVRKALIELEQQNLVVRWQGRGTYVAEHSRQRSLFHFFHVVDAGDRKELPVSIVFEQRAKRATREEARLLHLGSRASVHSIQRVRHLAGGPVILERVVVPTALFKDLKVPLNTPLEEELYVLYQRHYGVTIARADERLAAVAAGPADAEHLGVPEGSPLLEIVRIASDVNGNPVELRISRVHTANHRYASRID